MPKASDIQIRLQTGSNNQYYASWTFKETTTSTTYSSAGIKTGSLVSVSSNATYYNGAHMPDWVKQRKWYIVQVKGDRAVLGKDRDGQYNIQSAVNTKYLSGGGSSSSTTTTTSKDIKNLDYFEVKWYYDTGDDIWFESNSGQVEADAIDKDSERFYHIYSGAPENAYKIKVTILPVSTKKKEKNSKGEEVEVSYWTGTSASKTLTLHKILPLPEIPSTPTIEVDKLKLTMSVDGIEDPNTDQIDFEWIESGKSGYKNKLVDVKFCRASYVINLEIGKEYRVRCRARRVTPQGTAYSEGPNGTTDGYSAYTEAITTMPAMPTDFTCSATSETSVRFNWNAVTGADTYEIEYATKKEHFDGSDQVQSIGGITLTTHEKSGLSTGERYYFRLRASSDQNGDSDWTEPISLTLGTEPSAPTTWSSSSTVIVGEPLNLYWIHNSEDGSSQTTADLEIYVDGFKETHLISNSTDEDEKDKTSHYAVDTSEYTEGTKIEWRVRTAGITNAFGDWSVMRTVDVYAQPVLNVAVIDADGNSLSTINSFPFYISALSGPNTQTPLGYHVTIVANSTYDTTNIVGNSTTVSQGSEVYSNYFDINEPLMLELNAGNVDLQNGIAYTVNCTVSLNSGLTAEESAEFTVDWTDLIYEPNAEIGIDASNISALICPYAVDDEGNLIQDAVLAIYRREYDGSFTQIASGIPNIMNTYVTDPHPALDYARYRVVVMSNTNGGIGFYDIPVIPIGCKEIVIQWDENWIDINTISEDPKEEPAWVGSMLRFPYNIDVSESVTRDKTLVKYAGRTSPVVYHGTHITENGSWSADIPKSDTDTLYALRRLQKYKGNVYVREPSGVGYWASIDVSFSQKSRELTVPVTINVTRVEGGI